MCSRVEVLLQISDFSHNSIRLFPISSCTYKMRPRYPSLSKTLTLKSAEIIHLHLFLFSAPFSPASRNLHRPTPDSFLPRCVYGVRRLAAGMQDSLRNWTSQILSGPRWTDETAVQGPSTQLCVLTADWNQVWEAQLLMGPFIKEKRMLSSGKKIQNYLFSMFTVYLFLEGRLIWK